MESEPRVPQEEVGIRVVYVGASFAIAALIMAAILLIGVASVQIETDITLLDLGISVLLMTVLASAVYRFGGRQIKRFMGDALSPKRIITDRNAYLNFILWGIVALVSLVIYFTVRVENGGSLGSNFGRPIYDEVRLLSIISEFGMMGVATTAIGSLLVAGVLGARVVADIRESVMDWREERGSTK